MDKNGSSVRKLRVITKVISVPILLFSFLMVIGHIIFPDTESGTYPPIENLLPVLMLVSVLGLALAWWREGPGGVVSVIFFIIHLYAYWRIRGKFFPANMLVVFSPLLIDGILFIILSLQKET